MSTATKKTHRKVVRPLEDPIYREALATLERTGSWPKLGRSGKLPVPIAKAKAAIEAKLAIANKEKSRNFFKLTRSTGPQSQISEGTHAIPSTGVTTEQTIGTVESSPGENQAMRNEVLEQPSPVVSRSTQTQSSNQKATVRLAEDGSIEVPRTLAQVGGGDVHVSQWIVATDWKSVISKEVFPRVGSIFGHDLYLWAPRGGRCPFCETCDTIRPGRLSKPKLIIRLPWPYLAVTVRFECCRCQRSWHAWEPAYLETCPLEIQAELPFIATRSRGLDLSLIELLRTYLLSSGAISQGIGYINSQLSREYQRRAKAYDKRWTESLQNPFMQGQTRARAPIPQRIWPLSYSSVVRVMLLDFWQQKPYLLRELATVVSSSSLAIDYQRKISKRVIESRALGQAMTCVGDYNMILTTVIVPTTRCEYLKDALTEVYGRHLRAGVDHPTVLYTDVGCCAASSDGSGTLQKYVPSGVNIRLDPMHCIMRMVRASDQSHLLKNKFAKDLSKAFFVCNLEDERALRAAREALGMTGRIPKSERLKFVRRSVPEPNELDSRVERVIRTYHSVDESMKREWEEECALKKLTGQSEPSTLMAAPLGSHYRPLLGETFWLTYEHQRVHLLGGCLTDCAESMMKVGVTRYRNSSIELDHFRSLRGTSRVECVHSLYDRAFKSLTRVSRSLYDLKLLWTIHAANRRARLRLGMRVPDVHQTPREIELMGDVAREMYPDFRLVARDAPLPIVGFDYCASLDEIPPEEDILSAEVPLAQRGAILDEIMNDEQDTTTDTESAGFRSILEGEIDGGDGAEEPAGESDSDESTDSDEEPCGGRTFDPLPVATKRRKFLRWRTKAQSASYFRIDHEVGGAMERAFTSLRLEYPRATAAELLKLYTRDYLMKERANHEIDGRRPISYHPTSILYVEQWLSGYRKRSSFAGSAGSFNLKSMEAFGNLERSLAAQSSNKSPTEAVVVVHEHATLDSGPAEITANDLQDELETRPRKRMRISPAEGPVQQAIQTRAQGQVPRQSPREFKGRKCRFCGKILRKGFNEHIYDGSTHGLCPYRDAAAENKKDEEKKLEDERVEAAIQQALMADTLMGADKTGRKCSKCRRPYKSWLVRKGRSLHHQQFRAPVGNDKYTQVIWCPLLDGEEELETLQNEQIQRKRERWREANERKKNK